MCEATLLAATSMCLYLICINVGQIFVPYITENSASLNKGKNSSFTTEALKECMWALNVTSDIGIKTLGGGRGDFVP